MEKLLVIITRIDAYSCGKDNGTDEYVKDFLLTGEHYPNEAEEVKNIVFLHGCSCYVTKKGSETIDIDETGQNIKLAFDSLRLTNRDIYVLFHLTEKNHEMLNALMRQFEIGRDRIISYTSSKTAEWDKVNETAKSVRDGNKIDLEEIIRFFFPNMELESLIHLHKTFSIIHLEHGNLEGKKLNEKLKKVNQEKYKLAQELLKKDEKNEINNIDDLLDWTSKKIVEITSMES